VIYLDTSALLAELFAEDRRPPESIWSEPLVASRLLEYEVWVRVHARGLVASHGEAARDLVARVAMLELTPEVLARALDPFPVVVRTLDALHLASMHHLREHGQSPRLLAYDGRLRDAASACGFALIAG
jgi:predicted nucleic acid-binding protein